MSNINTREYWNKIWETEGANTWRKYPATFRKICELIGKEKQSVLDMGCGTGLLARRIKEAGHDVIGIDISDKAIEIMRNTFQINGIAINVPPIPEMTDRIDVITASEFLEHFENPDEIIKEFVRVSDRCIVAVPNNCLSNKECPEHHQKFTFGSLMRLMEKYYEKVRIYPLTDTFDKISIPVLICHAQGRKQ
jgi:ubiquinone/menaquinone biosynthesis C-methylase UbiE